MISIEVVGGSKERIKVFQMGRKRVKESKRGNLSTKARMVYSTAQYSTVQYSTAQYSTVQHSTVQYSTVHYLRRPPSQAAYC